MTVSPPPLSGLHLCVVRESHELGQKNFPPLAGPDRPPLPARWLGSGDGVFYFFCQTFFHYNVPAISIGNNAKLGLVGGEVVHTAFLTWWRGAASLEAVPPMMLLEDNEEL